MISAAIILSVSEWPQQAGNNVDAVVLNVPTARTYRYHTQGTAPRHRRILDKGGVVSIRIKNGRALFHDFVLSRTTHHPVVQFRLQIGTRSSISVAITGHYRS